MKIAVIGLGEVGSHYARGLAAGGAYVSAYNRNMDDPARRERYKALERDGVKLCSTVEEAARESALILAVTTSRTSLDTVRSVLPYLTAGQIYVECNSTVPDIKEEIAGMLSETADMVDATTMASVNQLGHKTPVNLSGSRAAEVSEILNGYGMNTRCIGDKVGQASALKVLRSIFMKGFEAVLVESMQASNRYGVAEQVFDSIIDFFGTKPLPDIMRMLIATDAIHAKRRAEEMTAITEMLRRHKIESTMSQACVKKLMWVDSLGMEQRFNGAAPADIKPVLDILSAGCCNEEQGD